MENVKISYKLPITATRANATKCGAIITIMLNRKVMLQASFASVTNLKNGHLEQYLSKYITFVEQNRRKTSTSTI